MDFNERYTQNLEKALKIMQQEKLELLIKAHGLYQQLLRGDEKLMKLEIEKDLLTRDDVMITSK